MDKSLIKEGKEIIGSNDIEGLQNFYKELKELNCDYKPNYQHIFHQLFLHACLKENKEIIIYLMGLYFEIFDEVSQIGLKHLFVHGKYLIKKNYQLNQWYDKNIIPLVK